MRSSARLSAEWCAAPCTLSGRWSSDMILASGARGRGFNSRSSPCLFCGRVFFASSKIPLRSDRVGSMAEWLRRLIRNQLEAIPREFESLCCRVFVQGLHLIEYFFASKQVVHTHYGIESASHFVNYQVLVAQRIAHQTSNLGVAGSNPVEHVLQRCRGPLV